MPRKNYTQVAPEIPDAASAPKQPPSMGTPLEREPVLMTSKKAREKFGTNVELYEELTGEIVTL